MDDNKRGQAFDGIVVNQEVLSQLFARKISVAINDTVYEITQI